MLIIFFLFLVLWKLFHLLFWSYFQLIGAFGCNVLSQSCLENLLVFLAVYSPAHIWWLLKERNIKISDNYNQILNEPFYKKE